MEDFGTIEFHQLSPQDGPEKVSFRYHYYISIYLLTLKVDE